MPLIRVLVAGIGGASLGTEIVKALKLAGRYQVYGCDISPYAYGHYMDAMAATFLVRRDRYIEEILNICKDHEVAVVVPGGDEPGVLLSDSNELLQQRGIHLAGNTKEVVGLCSDKAALFDFFQQRNIPTPRTVTVSSIEEMEPFPFPCVIKPAMGSGGSHMVQLADTRADAESAVSYLLRNGAVPVIQEYVPLDEGEFTVGVLHGPDGGLVGSIALKRMFNAKLSVMTKTNTGLISSGYSQGLIEDFREIRLQAENIATLCGSCGPLNIQGRVRRGLLLPFEVNPRFSATTYLRALAGFNEVDICIAGLMGVGFPARSELRPGYYLRSLAEVYVERFMLRGQG